MHGENKPGEVFNEERLKQSLLFTGMERMRGITPTDIDMVIEYGGKAFFYGECKTEGKEMPHGQRKLYERAVDFNNKAGIISAAILFTHNVPTPEPIIAKDQMVKKVYFQGKWTDVSTSNITVLDAIIKFEKYCEKKNIKL